VPRGIVELGEALATLLIRAGRPRDAERRINAVVAAAPKRSRPYTILSQALRAQGKLDGAEAALEEGFAETGGDAALHTERGMVLAERRDLAGARAAWQAALVSEPMHVAAFVLLADLVRHQRDASAAQTLIDAALASSPAHPELLWRAAQLALLTEPEGLARAARVTRLCERILVVLPDDAQASLTLARALIAQGDPSAARAHLTRVERVAPASAAGAEAQVTRLALEDPDAEREMQRLVLTAKTAPLAELPEVAARARRLATLHSAWPGWVAAGIAEERRGRWAAARGALEVALEIAPGATLAHLELAGVLLEMDNAAGALAHAERALALEGDSPRAIRLRARALAASGRWDEARAVLSRGIGAFPDDEATRGLAEVMRRGEQLRAPRGWQHRLRELWERRRRA
jgi:tetratricopeptide (TPR) repeat protein